MKGQWLLIAYVLTTYSCNESGPQESSDVAINDSSVVQFEEIDTTIEAYINGRSGNFIKLTDNDHLPDSVIPHIDSINSYCQRNNLVFESYFVWTEFIREDSNSIWIPVWDLEAFYFERQNPNMLGSPSPSSGEFEIELSSGTVLQKWHWQ